MKLTTLKSRVRTLNTQRTPVLQPGSWRTDHQTSAQRGYGYRWQQRRLEQLRAHPLCRYCAAEGRVTVATVADHIIPHRGDRELFDGELQSLCAECHNRKTARGG